jgi:SAM-dependent methyltransferase
MTIADIKKIAKSLLVADEFREFVGRCRYRLMRHRLGTLEESGVDSLKNTVSHNLTALSHISTDFRMRRMKWLIFGTIANEAISSSSRILMIGPRTENEILFLHGLGYPNVVGLDLISYSPYVRLGDMHNMPFEDDSFDVVICGWTLSYSKHPSRVASEIVRVLRSEAILGIGVEHAHLDADTKQERPEFIDPKEALVNRINSCAQIHALFEPFGRVQTLLQYNAFLSGRKPSEIQNLTGLSSSQVLYVARLLKTKS